MTKSLGSVAGTGELQAPNMVSQRVDYEFDRFRAPNGKVSASGEVSTVDGTLDAFFGLPDLLLLTDDGLHLKLMFSGPKRSDRQTAAHVDVADGVPGPSNETH